MNEIQFKDGVYSFTAANGKVYKSKNEKYIMYQLTRNGGSVSVNTVTEVVEEKQQFTINERFEFIANYVSMVAEKIQPSLIISGTSGVGKSFTVYSTLNSDGFVDISNTENFIEGERLPTKHYKVIKGFSTPRALYTLLYENKDSILIFDDTDNILVDPVATNLLKSVTDSNSERIVSWNAETRGDSDIPRSFRFTGGIIFISNLHKNKIPAALRTRALLVEIDMNTDQRIERMEHIVQQDHFMPEIDISTKITAMAVVKKFKDDAKELSLRSLMQTVRIFQKFSGTKAENLAKYSLSA